MAVNKFVYNGQVKFDLTADTVARDKVLDGTTFHLPSGEKTTGTCTFDVNSSADTAKVAEVLDGKTFSARGANMTGTMPNIGKQTSTISTKSGSVAIAQGYHDGSGSVVISSVEQAKLVPENIAEGITIMGVVGTHKAGADEVKQNKSVTPTFSKQTIVPDDGYTCLAQVEVAAIPYTETANAAGGTTVTIG